MLYYSTHPCFRVKTRTSGHLDTRADTNRYPEICTHRKTSAHPDTQKDIRTHLQRTHRQTFPYSCREGNYWDDQDVHDCCDVDWETCEILVRKISKALSLPTAPTSSEDVDAGQKVLIFMPRLMQLPLTILAAYRAGLVAIVMVRERVL